MNEKALSVIGQYGLEVRKSVRTRGGIAVLTDDGYKLLYECTRSDSYYERENMITAGIKRTGFEYIDTYVMTAEGTLFSQDAQGRKYILKDWFDAQECDIRNETHVAMAAGTLAVLHGHMMNMDKCEHELKYNNATDMRMKFDKHTKEMRMVGNYLKGKKNKNEFEMLMRRSLMTFHEEALIAAQELEEMDYGSRIEKARTSYEMCHGSYNYHNVLFTDRGCAVTGFEHCCVDCQINDLYQFMRKLLEKNGWDARAGHSVIEAYSEVRPVSDDDMKLLRINFLYPEKFWKVINFYNNSNKSWIPRKSIEKLEGVLAQNDARRAFIETLH
ncbi:hypothetical protein NQ488_13985 [[Bacteroides] pectinophilus]|uniref:Aminoglycoside phosphotransferase domain-containing protein n=1 Tax=[Bacteroides] pectinophilus ATCC 43243 TaxID=483218 RepID=B7APJ3_9FIRM|nr:spore coat protein, CotS family [[Bacteroides] pectinophilus ATCC 43243]UWN95632.1 hypothetical protein NQ488_13985 [[Bacteroides] pectinophilus]